MAGRLLGVDASRVTTTQPTGTEHYACQLIRHLIALDQANRYRLYFNAPPPEGLFPDLAHVEERVIPFPRLWTHLRLSLEMLQAPPDLLFVPAHVLPLIRPRRTVVTVHDLGYLYYPEAHTPFARWYLDISTRWNARVATLILADSVATQRDLVRFYGTPLDKIRVVYPGPGQELSPARDPEALARVRQRYGLPARYMLYVGTLHPRKNLERLVQACHRLCQGYPGPLLPHLVIAGKKGWLYEALYRQIGLLGLQGRVHLPGYVPQEDLPALLSGAQAFLLPSLYEGFGLPVLEAMACGVPVICSNVSSLPEVAGDAALLVDPLDVQAITDAMARLLAHDTLRQELVERGLAQAARFSWLRCAQEALAVLEQAASASF